jgi:hypothetical protein
VDESWINTPVRLIPRMKETVDAHYPGTRTAITEYNWGALDHINGALTQADVLGIFGREGLDLATLWAPPSAPQPGAFAFRMYRNYDGAGGRFGDVGVAATSTDQSQLSVYAAERSDDGTLTVMVVNKSGTELTSTVSLPGYAGGTAAVHRYGAADTARIVRAPDQAVAADDTLSHTFPADSITLLAVTAAPPPAAGCAVAYTVTSQWPGGFIGRVRITNTGPEPVDGWTLRFTFPATGQSVQAGWSARWTAAGADVTASNLGWNRTVTPDASVDIGFLGRWSGSNPEPSAFTLNDAACTTS